MAAYIRSDLLHEFQIQSGVRVNRIYDLFKQLSKDDFSTFLSEISALKSKELTLQLVYYLNLFRDDSHTKALLSSEEIPLQFIEYLLYSSYSRALLEEEFYSKTLDESLIHFPQEVYSKLLDESSLVNGDYQLYYYIVSKLDRHHMDAFFNSLEDIRAFLEGLATLPDIFRQDLFVSNIDFYGYVFLFASTWENFDAETIFGNLSESLHDLQSLKKTINKICKCYDLEEEKKLTLPQRNCKRFAQIIQEIEESANKDHTMRVLEHEGVIIDSAEKSLITEIAANPLFKNIRYKYLAFETL